MIATLLSLLYLCNRYVHIVATTLIVGGTLFYEMVVPAALGELKTEVQLALFGRMRWLFRWIVYTSATLLLLSGAISSYRNWYVYNGEYRAFLIRVAPPAAAKALDDASLLARPHWWYGGHVVLGLAGMLISVLLVSGGRPPDRPIKWMRISLLLLMVGMFLASAARNARLRLFEAARSGDAVPSAVPD
jgi:hypothetical protein